jgi:hypothetical protein
MSRFVTTFDPSDETHVRWLASMLKASAKDYASILTSNPMGITVEARDILDWAQTVFVLCTKYCKAQFEGQAWIFHM